MDEGGRMNELQYARNPTTPSASLPPLFKNRRGKYRATNEKFSPPYRGGVPAKAGGVVGGAEIEYGSQH
jgi:hypothetical protein